MKIKAATIIALCMLSITTCAQTNGWTEVADFGGGFRMTAFAFSIGGKGYAGIGYSGSAFCNDWWEYDPATNTWTKKSDFPGGARQRGISFSIGSKGYVGLGINGNTVYDDIWEYDPSNDTWTQKNNFGGTGRTEATGFSIGSKGYVGTGIDNPSAAHFTNDFWEYDPSTDIWTQKANLPGSVRVCASSFSIGTKGYLGVGSYTTFLSDFWEYNPQTDTWTQKAHFGGGKLDNAVSFSIGNRGYIGTGNANSGTRTNIFYSYDPIANLWTQEANFGGARRTEGIGFSIGNNGYIGTGYDSAMIYAKDFWKFGPDSTTGIHQNIKESRNINIYPNPSNGVFQLTVSNEQLTDVKIYDVNGKLVFSKSLTPVLSKGEGVMTVDANSLNEGVYNVSFTNSEGTLNKKIVIIK